MVTVENMSSSENIEGSNEHEDDYGPGNPAMADALQKVLRMGKKSKKPTLILASAKTITEAKDTDKTATAKPKTDFQIETVSGEKIEVKKEETPKLMKAGKSGLRKNSVKKNELHNRGRHKPSALDREKERPLMKIATKGVVQLFNAVREQQQIINKKLMEAGPSETKKEKALKSINKKAFLDVLLGHGATKTDEIKKDEIKEEKAEDDNEPEWEVLRDDFMMGAKLKDWDKEEREGLENSEESISKPKKKRSR